MLDEDAQKGAGFSKGVFGLYEVSEAKGLKSWEV